MSAELIQRLAASGMNMRQAAQSQSMPFWKFRELRDLYPEIEWGLSDGCRKGLKARHKIDADKAVTIYRDQRKHGVIAAEYGISRASVANIKAGRQWSEATGAI